MNTKFTFFFLVFIFCKSFGQKVFDCVQLKDEKSLHQEASYIDVGNQNYDIDYIITNFLKLNPQKLLTENDDLGFTKNNYWVHFQLENTASQPVTFFIETARPVTDIARLYFLPKNKKEFSVAENGDAIPYSKKSFSDRKMIFKIVQSAKSKTDIYLHLKSDGEVLKIPIVARTAENLMQLTAKEQLIFGVFYGILGISALIYLFFFFALREKTLLYYSLYVIFIGLMQFALDGYFHQYITPFGGWLSEHSVLIIAISATFFLGKYCEVFLKLQSHLPVFYKLFLGVYVLALLLLLTYLFIPQMASICYPMANVLGLFFLLLIISSISTLYYKKIKVDAYFSFGILFLILGFVIFILNNFGQVPNTFFTQNSSKFGTGFEIIFLSLSMSNFIRNLKNEKNELVKSELVKSLEINELKSYFLSNISHELRTPLNAIINLNEINSKLFENENLKKNCAIIDYSSQNLLASINDIFDFSKIQKNQLHLIEKPFDITKTFATIKANFEMQFADKNLKFNFNFENKVQNLVLGDEARLCQVVTNILNNSIKFTTTGFVNLTAVLQQKSATNSALFIAITDTGIGIESEKKSKIFDSFSQDNISNKRKFGGLGLGLYIVKTLVDLQKGKITINSEINQGTTVEVAMDFKLGAEITVQINANTEIVSKNIQILYVEDNKMNQMVVKMLAKNWQNYSLDIAENGEECLSILAKNKYDLILMDLQMPVMDGYEATIEIRKGNSGINDATIPIIAVTADVIETTKQTVFDIGMNDYITKPINKELLFEAISKFIKK